MKQRETAYTAWKDLATEAFECSFIADMVHCLQVDYTGLWVNHVKGTNIPAVALGQAI